MPKTKEKVVHKRQGVTGGRAVDGTYFPIDDFGKRAVKLVNKWGDVTCKRCLRHRPSTSTKSTLKSEPKRKPVRSRK